MSFLSDKHAIHVLICYGATLAILGGLVWTTLAANARARRELEAAEKERRR